MHAHHPIYLCVACVADCVCTCKYVPVLHSALAIILLLNSKGHGRVLNAGRPGEQRYRPLPAGVSSTESELLRDHVPCHLTIAGPVPH